MRDVKRCWNTYCLYDYRGVENHLSAMAAQGWRLEKAGNSLWKYRRAEPANLRYAVTYNAGASQFNPGPTEGQQSLEDLCAAAGWEKVSDWFQMQIFATEDPAAVPLETDEALRLENIHRSMRKNFLPSNIILLLLGLLMSASLVYSLVSGKILRLLSSNAHLFSGSLYLLVSLLGAYTLTHYYRWRKASRRSIGEGGACLPAGPGYRRVNRAALVLTGLMTALYLLAELFGSGGNYFLFYAAYLVLFLLVVFLVPRTTALMRKLKASRSVNIAVTLAVDFVLAFALIGGLVYGTIRSGWLSGGSGETYTYQNVEFDVHPREDVPLTLSDLTGETYRHVSRSWWREGSILLPKWHCWERVLENAPEEDGRSGALHLSYTVCLPRFQWFYDGVAEELLEEFARSLPGTGYAYGFEDPAPWGADTAYRRWLDGRPMNSWLLCFPDRIVELSVDRDLTEAEKALAGSRLEAEI
ncbi:DUF2812 domain-containing protein [Oscillospiraceae bacterium 38-13]